MPDDAQYDKVEYIERIVLEVNEQDPVYYSDQKSLLGLTWKWVGREYQPGGLIHLIFERPIEVIYGD